MHAKSYLQPNWIIRSGRCVLGAVSLFNAFMLVVIYKVDIIQIQNKINVFLYRDINRHVFYRFNRLLKHDMVAQRLHPTISFANPDVARLNNAHHRIFNKSTFAFRRSYPISPFMLRPA